jgi:hypothetical protein
MAVTQEQILAFAVYEIRFLLAGHLGSDCASDQSVRTAAHLAYALHNQADAILQGKSFDIQQAIASLEGVDQLLAAGLQRRLAMVVGHEA